MKDKIENLGKLVVSWMINGTSGHGEPIGAKAASAWCIMLNNEYGPGTHWTSAC